MSEPLWASMDLLREAAASRALDGETQHEAQDDWLCCLDHARERVAALERANAELKHEVHQWIEYCDNRVDVIGVYQGRIATLEAECERLRRVESEAADTLVILEALETNSLLAKLRLCMRDLRGALEASDGAA